MTDDRLLLGVAVAIPQPHATVLTSWRRRVGDPSADSVFPHVTLLPPTAVEHSDLPDVEKHLADVAEHARPFLMHLAGTGTFRPTTPVVFVQVARGVGDCEELEVAIRRGPLERELDYPYHPHVTVAHDVDDAGMDAAYDGLAGFIARFEVTSFVLFSRDADHRWHWHREFPLGGGAH
ncbi:MAG TPA: 2'-5' RNA ligase family protein [Jatrophihabitans sp.]|jgi:2'-5' RNA ligase